jgi:hypothetical protein
MHLTPGELKWRFAFAAVMIAVGLTPPMLLLIQAGPFGNHGAAGNHSGPAVHASAMIETSLLLVAGIALAVATAVEARRRPGR